VEITVVRSAVTERALPEGKAAYNVTLAVKNVERARRKQSNLSRLLDRLLAAWLG
jgi:hypothetical protein